MSAVTKTTRMSNESVKPANLSWVRLLTIANDIYRWKGAITDVLRENGENARDKKTPHDIMKVLKASSIYVTLPELKGLLREFGFPHSGGACSFLDLLKRCQIVVNSTDPQTNDFTKAFEQTRQANNNQKEETFVEVPWSFEVEGIRRIRAWM